MNFSSLLGKVFLNVIGDSLAERTERTPLGLATPSSRRWALSAFGSRLARTAFHLGIVGIGMVGIGITAGIAVGIIGITAWPMRPRPEATSGLGSNTVVTIGIGIIRITARPVSPRPEGTGGVFSSDQGGSWDGKWCRDFSSLLSGSGSNTNKHAAHQQGQADSEDSELHFCLWKKQNQDIKMILSWGRRESKRNREPIYKYYTLPLFGMLWYDGRSIFAYNNIIATPTPLCMLPDSYVRSVAFCFVSVLLVWVWNDDLKWYLELFRVGWILGEDLVLSCSGEKISFVLVFWKSSRYSACDIGIAF